MDSDQPHWMNDYNQEQHYLDLSNNLINTDNKAITVDDINSIVKSTNIDHQQLKVINLGNYL